MQRAWQSILWSSVAILSLVMKASSTRMESNETADTGLDELGEVQKRFTLRRVNADQPAWDTLRDMFKVTLPGELGWGKDIIERRPMYNDLFMLAAWEVKYTDSVYEAEKAEVVKENTNSNDVEGIAGASVDGGANEKLLLHGTRAENVKTILTEGLLDPKAFRPGDKRILGPGVYLADRSEKSDQYSTPGLPEDLHRLLTNMDGRLDPFLQGYPSDVLFCFVVKTIMGRVAIIDRDGQVNGAAHSKTDIPMPTLAYRAVAKDGFQRGFFVNIENPMLRSIKDALLVDRGIPKEDKMWHTKFLPSKNHAKFENAVVDRFNEVIAPADGRRTEIAYLIAYARCQNDTKEMTRGRPPRWRSIERADDCGSVRGKAAV